jgi:hypothetical protein
VNVAFKHLEAKLRFGELSVGQWAAVLAGVLSALVFAEYLSPLDGLAGVIVAVYLGAIPVSAAFFASLSEFDLWGLIAAAIRWRRREGRHVPGAGSAASGYVVLGDGGDGGTGPVVAAELDLGALWSLNGAAPEAAERWR